ncbi:hypothetical protein ACCO45_010009 [Purpureocillium lilacinum]|uniref:Uncharacterized protein n=1 Tax=Purpureocillium lilacinum TaxID=33203 RepID=A0ACC4DG77_PURLI
MLVTLDQVQRSVSSGSSADATGLEETAGPFAVVSKLCGDALEALMRTGTCREEIAALQLAWDKACIGVRARGWEGYMDEANSEHVVQKLVDMKDLRDADTMRLANKLQVGDVNYTVGKMLGVGTFGVVYQCKSIPDDKVVAIKFRLGCGLSGAVATRPLREKRTGFFRKNARGFVHSLAPFDTAAT